MNKIKKKKKVTPYLNNRDLLAETLKSKEQGKMTDTLARMLMTLVDKYAGQKSFCNYSYNDDMQAYALMMLSKTWNGFKPEKSSNAFAFFTQCVKNSFRQYLNTERRQRDIRDKALVEQGMNPSHTYEIAYRAKIKADQAVEDEEDFEQMIAVEISDEEEYNKEEQEKL